MSEQPFLEALETFSKSLGGMHDLKWQIKKLRTVQDWALAQQPLKPGDRARLVDPPSIHRDSGWWAYRECLTLGVVGTIGQVDYNSLYDYWGAEFTPDSQWTVDFSGKRHEITRERLGSFFMPLRRLERIEAVSS